MLMLKLTMNLIFQEVDVEAGEKDELLDKEGKETDSNKKEEGDELEEVKVKPEPIFFDWCCKARAHF